MPIGLVIECAHRHDSKLLAATIESIPVERPKIEPGQPQHLCLDKGYDYDWVRDLVWSLGYTLHLRGRGQEQQERQRVAGHKARRWVVERTHGWLNRFRAILIRWNKKPENYLALLHLACAIITFRFTSY